MISQSSVTVGSSTRLLGWQMFLSRTKCFICFFFHVHKHILIPPHCDKNNAEGNEVLGPSPDSNLGLLNLTSHL